MKIALCTTTINIPRVLEWYKACDHTLDPFDHPGASTLRFFVVGDQKTPHEDVWALARSMRGSGAFGAMSFTYLPPDSKDIQPYKCRTAIGPNSIQLRNIAFLEALKWGADVIVSIDDDNIPMNARYFATYESLFAKPFSGLQATAAGGFFDVGQFLIPQQKQRGVPHNNHISIEIGSVVGAKIGVAQGMCMGDADVDAATRFDDKRPVHQMSEVVRNGLVVDPDSKTIWNSQNTAIRRELVPAWGMIPFVGRMDDIYASIICHRVMREYGYYAHYGLPAIWQTRNEHNLVKDMRAEIDGYDNCRKLASVLDNTLLAGKSVIADCRQIWRTLSTTDIFPGTSIKAMEAWLDDCESIG